MHMRVPRRSGGVLYEMRRHGYDVEAQPIHSNDKWLRAFMIDDVKQEFWRGAFRHTTFEGAEKSDRP